MAESASLASESQNTETDSEAMHVDVTPTASDREDDVSATVAVEKPESNLNLLFKVVTEQVWTFLSWN